MLDAKLIRTQPETIKQALAKRHSALDLDTFLQLDRNRREILLHVEKLKEERNAASAEVGKRKKNKESADDLLPRLNELSDTIKELDAQLREAENQTQTWLMSCPNIPHSSVPEGIDENDNREEKKWKKPQDFDFTPLEHWELGTKLGLFDFERAGKITGSRFTVLRGGAARLERALTTFMLDIHTQENGYTEILPPFIVNANSLQGTGQLPKFAEDLFKLENRQYYLTPTAEVPLTNMHRDEILAEHDLPLAYTAYTPCFRSEAGSYGKDTKGLIRQHQFDKVELVRFAHPDNSYDELEKMLSHAEGILQRLELPYRVITLCSGDMGFSAAKTYDIEVWLPGQNTYREISSCSNTEDFQARRAGIRFSPQGGGKTRFVHTLNGSGLAVGRTMVAIFENYQQKDGTVVIPEALRPYMGGMEIFA